MTLYHVQLQDWFEVAWCDLGHGVGVEADDVPGALQRIDRSTIGLLHGVVYRLAVTGPDGWVRTTAPVTFPDFPDELDPR